MQSEVAAQDSPSRLDPPLPWVPDPPPPHPIAATKHVIANALPTMAFASLGVLCTKDR
jgi:hypothetical protein